MAHSAIMSVRITGNADDAVKAFEKTTTKAAAFGSAIGGLAVKGVTALWDTVKGFAGDVVNMSDSTDKFMNTMSFAGIDTKAVQAAAKETRKYADATVADGCNWRLTPQFDYRVGSFGLAGEYVVSSTELRSGAATATLANRAWQVSAGYVLTGEASSVSGVKPRNSFNLADGTWGAFELVGRVSGFRVDDDAFPLFASVGSNASEATAYGVGFNWYLSRNLKFSTDFYVTDFGFADTAPATSTSAILRQDEQALISRLQVAF